MKEEFRDLYIDSLEQAKITLTGIPYDKNASVGKGACEAPDHLRELSYCLPALNRDGIDISHMKLYDYGNIECKENEDCETYFQRVQKQVRTQLMKDKAFPFFFGGDHSVAIPLEKAFFDATKEKGKTPVIIHLDAHPDICDIYEGSIYSHASVNARSIEYGYETKNVALIGMRGFEAQEMVTFQKHPEIYMVRSSELIKNGVTNVIDELKKKYSGEDYQIYLSLDIDIHDPAYAPGTGTPEAFGPSSLMVLELLQGIFNHLNVCAMDFVEIAPKLDVNDITSWLGLKIMYEVIGFLKEK